MVLIVLFGSKKLPHAARSLGQSMRILKREVQGLHEDDPTAVPSAPASGSTATGSAELTATPQPDQQAQIEALRQQIRDLRRAATMDPLALTVQAGTSAGAQRAQQAS